MSNEVVLRACIKVGTKDRRLSRIGVWAKDASGSDTNPLGTLFEEKYFKKIYETCSLERMTRQQN